MFQVVLINLFNCAVPLFLAISGYFIGRKNMANLAQCRSFWSKQIPTVYLPCLISSLPWFAISCMSATGWGGVVARVVYLLLCGYSAYYFIALVIECYLLAPLLVKHNNVFTLMTVVVISFISRAAIEYVRFHHGVELPLIVKGSFPPLLLFFYLGIFLTRHTRDYSLLLPVGMIVIGMLLGLLHLQYIEDAFGVSVTGQKISLYIFDAGVIMLCMSRKAEQLYRNNIVTRMILFVGEISFGIYLTHMYLISIADTFLPNLRDSWAALWIFSTSLTIGVIVITKRIAPAFSLKYLGYR